MPPPDKPPEGTSDEPTRPLAHRGMPAFSIDWYSPNPALDEVYPPAVRRVNRRALRMDPRFLSLTQQRYVPGPDVVDRPRIALVQFDLEELIRQISVDSKILQQISPDKFEDAIQNRLEAMGLSVQRTGNTNRKDGGIDFVFFSKAGASFPFLGAVQAKHHRGRAVKTGAADVRDFVGAMACSYFQTGLLVTNTTFSPDAQWFAKKHEPKVRLRDFNDLVRWFAGNFDAEAEWREIPARIELCPGYFIDLNIPGREQGS